MAFSPHITPLHRPAAERSQPTLEALRDALQTAAEFVAIDPETLPIFERIDAEIRARENSGSSLDRALALAAKNELQNGPQNGIHSVIRLK